MDEDHKSGPLDRRRRQRPQRYSEREFVEGISDQEEGFDSDDNVVGEVVYDEEYLRQRKHRKKLTSSSEGEGDDEYNWSEENGDEAEEEDEEEDSLNLSDDSDQPRGRLTRPEMGRGAHRGTKLKSVDGVQGGLRRSKRATRNRINYQKYELSESENESTNPGMDDNNGEYSSMESQDSEGDDNDETQEEKGSEEPTYMDVIEKDENRSLTKPESPSLDDPDGVRERKFLDLNELAPGPGFEDGPSVILRNGGGGGGGKHE